MKIGVTEISPREVQHIAEKKFKDGYYCCEALMSAVRDAFKLDVPEEVIAMSSGMAVGIGKSGCACGAFNGGVLALGMFFGRTEQNKVVVFDRGDHHIGDFVQVKITESSSATLKGIVI